MDSIIDGIQQIGIGVKYVKTVFNWYREHLGFDILLFKDEAVASLMTKYTNGNAERRNAYLSLNMVGGGGLEIWQFKDRTPTAPKTPIRLGDLGIYAMKIRCADIQEMHRYLKKLEVGQLTEIVNTSFNQDFFYFEDPFGNQVQMVSDSYKFCASMSLNGGVMGAVIGVSDMDVSVQFYKNLFDYGTIVYDGIESITDSLSLKSQMIRKVILKQDRKKFGGFGDLLGPTQLELIQVLDRIPFTIYENRLWGDLGYIHLCFDVQGMNNIRMKARELGSPFTVDSSNSFDMGDAAGHFSYVEDPDGTLIELVETHKVPVLKAFGLFLNLKKRDPYKTLPKWLVKSLKLHRVTKNL